MDLELPNHLLATRDLLMRSLVTHPLEKAPAMPASLAADLAARSSPRSTTLVVSPSVSWVEKVRAFLATPSFGAAAAAVVVLGVAIPMLSTHDEGTAETFRGGESTALPVDAVRIVFIGEHPTIQSAVQSSGDFEAAAISSEASATAASTIPGPKVTIDFYTQVITAVARDGSTVFETPIPSRDSEVPAAIASAVSRL